jgi:TolB-like protein/DNA-binding winged helix-turn-helix (wHTH) protein/tetratricopeptide (TPR) repeat protein
VAGRELLRVVRFGSFEFDAGSGELRSQGRKVALQGQPAQILSHLLASPGQLVTREELRRTVWANDTFVDFDSALNVAINKVRQALGDSASAPRFIETIPRRGYRFLADVHAVEGAVDVRPPQAPRLPTTRTTRRWQWVAGVAVALGLLAVWSSVRVNLGSASPRSIAVLPFRPLVDQPRDEALEVGLADAVIVRLGRLEQLRVPSINAVQRYAAMETDPLAAGRDLGVDAVLDGRLLRRNGNVRLSARLLDVETGGTLWAEQWDFPWSDIFTVQDAMAAAVTRALALRLVPEEQESLRKHPTNVAAYDDYLRARYLLLRRTVGDSRRAAEMLEKAVSLDPDSAAAHASLAFAYISIPLLEGPTTPFVELGRRAVRRALELDPRMAEAHAVLGRILVHFDWDAEASDRSGQRAMDLDPTNPFVLHCRSLMLADQGRFEEALALADRARALDPTSVLANRDRAIILYLARRYGDCVEQCQRTLELDRYSVAAYLYMGRAYEAQGRDQQAIAAYVTALGFTQQNPEVVASLREAAARGGLSEFLRMRLRYLLEQTPPRPASIAAAYAKLGDHDRAFAWLEKLLAERGAWVVGLKVKPEWDPLRSDPRFQVLLRRANLVPLTAPTPDQ